MFNKGGDGLLKSSGEDTVLAFFSVVAISANPSTVDNGGKGINKRQKDKG